MQKEGKDQTFYFALADCDGALEIYEDQVSKKEHLLGLSTLWHDINDDDYKDFEDKDHVGMDEDLQNMMHLADESAGLMDTSDPNSIQDAV